MSNPRGTWRPLVPALLLGGSLLAAGAWWYVAGRPDYRLKQAQTSVRRGDYDQARQAAVLLEADGYAEHAALLRAGVLVQRARPYLEDAAQVPRVLPLLREAAGELRKVRDVDALRLPAARLRGQCLYFLKDTAEAERALRFVLSERPDDLEAHRTLAAIYYDQRAWNPTLEHFRQWVRLDPADGRPLRMQGLLYKNLNQFAQAVAAYEQAVARPLSERVAQEVRLELAECQVRQGDYAEALKNLDGCGEALAQTPDGLLARAECLWGTNQPAEARAVLDAALKTYPNAADLLRLRAKLHRDAGEYPQEAALLERALEQDRADYETLHQLGQVYERLGRRADAAQARTRAEQVKSYLKEFTELNLQAAGNPWDGNVRQRLAEVCRLLDKPEEARRWQATAAACAARGG